MKNIVTLSLAAIAVMLAAASSASATVKYEFTALSSLQDGVSGSFTYISPDFITDVRRIVPQSALESCTVVTSGSQTCAASQQFFSDSKRFFGGTFDSDLVAFTANAISYHFDLGAFQTLGFHETILFGSDQAGTLQVSQAGAVPEPASWAMMIGGFGLVGATMRRRALLISKATA